MTVALAAATEDKRGSPVCDTAPVMSRACIRLAATILATVIVASCAAGGAVDEVGMRPEPRGVLLISYVDGEELSVGSLEVATGEIVRLTPEGRLAGPARWSPDGQQLAVAMGASLTNDRIRVHRSSVDAGDLWVAVEGADAGSDDSLPTWSPDCGSIAFAHFLSDGSSDIWISDIDGSKRRRITDHGAATVTAPDWSPRGDRLVFSSDRGGDSEVYTIAIDGTDELQLTDNSHADSWPRWSPDASRIAWDRRVGTEMHLFTMNPDGSEPFKLTAGRSRGTLPVWSPDGEWLAYWLRDEQIGFVRSDGTDRRELDVVASPNDWGPRTGSCD